MLPNHFFDVVSNETTVVLSTKYSYTFYFLGFSGKASAQPAGDPEINSVVLQPSPDATEKNPDILVVTAMYDQSISKGRVQIEYCKYVLPVYFVGDEKNREIHIVLGSIYVPSSLVQAYDYYLHVKSGDYIFTTQGSNLHKEDETYVSDGDLLCRFATGRATIEEVLEAAERPKREKDESEKLARENAELTAQLELHRESVAQARTHLRHAQDRLENEKKLWGDSQLTIEAAHRCIRNCQIVSTMKIFGRMRLDGRLVFVTKRRQLAEIKRLCAKYFLKPDAS